MIRGSRSYNTQKGFPTAMIKIDQPPVPFVLSTRNFIKQVNTKMCVLYRILRRASNNKSGVFSIDTGKEVHNIFHPLCSFSNQPMVSRGVNISPHQDLNHDSMLSNLAVAHFPNGNNGKGSRPLIPPSMFFSLERTSISASIVLVPDM